jgi:DNA-binding PadR family transcriptional regulator
MPTKDDLLEIVPIGEANALSSRLLWQQLGMWSLASIRARLNDMAAAGLIERKRVIRDERPTSLYFRRTEPSAGLSS